MVKLGEVATMLSKKKFSGSELTYRTIVKKKAYERKDKPVKDGDAWDNGLVKSWLIENKGKYFKAGGNYQINFLYSFGWRAGYRFKDDNIDFPSRPVRYEDSTTEVGDEIYGIQIIEIN